MTASTFEPDGDTAAGDNAAIGYTSAEGLILTGQGSSTDVTIKNDADTTVMSIATGTTQATFAGEVVAASLDISGNIDVDGTDTNLIIVTTCYQNKCAAATDDVQNEIAIGE